MNATPKPHLNRALVVFSFAALWVVAGCNEQAPPEDPGGLSITWRISPLGCKESGVRSVELSMTGPESRIGSYDCDTGRAIIDAVQPGAYQMTLIGRDSQGRATFEAISPREVGISPGEITTLDSVSLTARAGTLYVGWYFDNGRLCASNNVDHISIGLYDKDAFLIAETEASCDDGEAILEGIKSGSYLIEAVASAPDGRKLFRSVREVSIERGAEAHTDLQLDACDEECEP